MMSKSNWVAGFMLLVPALALARGVSEGNGDGIAEQNFVFAAMKLGDYVQLCLSSTSCGLTPGEADLLGKIEKEARSEDLASLLEFRSETRNPGTFVLNGTDKIAKTGLTPGSRILVKVDQLYPKDSTGAVKPLSLTTAVGILTHEMGHHQGVTDEKALDTLGAKVRKMFSDNIQQSDGLFVVNWDQYDPAQNIWPRSEVMVQDGAGLHEVSGGIFELIKKSGACTQVASTPGLVKFVGFTLSNLHSQRPQTSDIESASQSENRIWMTWRADINEYCPSPAHLDSSFPMDDDQQLVISLEIEEKVNANGAVYWPSDFRYTGRKKLEILNCNAPGNQCR